MNFIIDRSLSSNVILLIVTAHFYTSTIANMWLVCFVKHLGSSCTSNNINKVVVSSASWSLDIAPARSQNILL